MFSPLPLACTKIKTVILQLAPAQHTLFPLLRLPQMFEGLTIQACSQKILHVVFLPEFSVVLSFGLKLNTLCFQAVKQPVGIDNMEDLS